MEQLAFAEVQPGMTYAEIEKIVVTMLKDYKRLPGRIRAAERKAQGKGLSIWMVMDRVKMEQLATVGRAYTTDVRDYMHVQKAETLFHQIKGDDEEDEKALDEIRGLMIGTRPFGGEAYVDENGHVVALEEEARRRWAEEAERLRNEKEIIEEALEELKGYAPHLEHLLRARYIQGKSVLQVTQELNISERTHDHWKRKAVCEFAMLAGIVYG